MSEHYPICIELTAVSYNTDKQGNHVMDGEQLLIRDLIIRDSIFLYRIVVSQKYLCLIVIAVCSPLSYLWTEGPLCTLTVYFHSYVFYLNIRLPAPSPLHF
jgi:hypothetical protein